MRTQTLLISGILVIIVLLAGGLVYLGKTNKLMEYWSQLVPQTSPPSPEEPEEEIVEEEEVIEEVEKETVLVKDDFTITLPPGWAEIVPPEESILAMVVDSREEIKDEKVIETGFMTNFSIKVDDLTQYAKEYTLAEYVNNVKTSLIQVIPDIQFILQTAGTINDYQAIFVEAESTQEEIDFGTLLVFIEGRDNLLWAISFNTLQNSWPNYQDIFYQMAESFKLRYKI